MTTKIRSDLNVLSKEPPNEQSTIFDARRPTESISTAGSREGSNEIADLKQAFPWMFEERTELNEISALERLFPWLAFDSGQPGPLQDTRYPNLNETDTRLASLSPSETHDFAEVMASMGGASW